MSRIHLWNIYNSLGGDVGGDMAAAMAAASRFLPQTAATAGTGSSGSQPPQTEALNLAAEQHAAAQAAAGAPHELDEVALAEDAAPLDVLHDLARVGGAVGHGHLEGGALQEVPAGEEVGQEGRHGPHLGDGELGVLDAAVGHVDADGRHENIFWRNHAYVRIA